MNRLSLLVGSFALLIGSEAFADVVRPADSPPDHAIELGVGIGQSSVRIAIPGLDGTDTIRATGYKGFIGYRFSKYLTVEAAYIDGGILNQGDSTDRIDLHPRTEQLSLIGSYPVLPYVSLYGRVGADHWNARFSVSDSQLGKANLGANDTNVAWGAGIQTFVDRALLRLEFEQMTANQNLEGIPVDFRSRLISLSAVWLL